MAQSRGPAGRCWKLGLQTDLVNQPFDVDSAQNKLGAIDCGGVELAMGSRLQSNGISLAAKVDALMPWPIFSHLPVLQLFAIVWSAIVCPAIVSDLSV